MNILNKAAEILMESGYAVQKNRIGTSELYWIIRGDGSNENVEPFSDTLEGRRQADAIEDWLIRNELQLWLTAKGTMDIRLSAHQWRLDRIHWCLEQLEKNDA